jgi:hypothetical protein
MARTRSISGALAALLVAALAGAGGSCSSFGSVSLGEFLAENARLVCGAGVACGGTLDEAACELRSEANGDRGPQTIADLASGKMIFDGGAAARCLDYRRRHLDDCDSGSLRADPAHAACNEVFVGALGAGEACFDSSECQSGSCAGNSFCTCDASTVFCRCCVGACVPPAALGEDCTNNACEKGLRCAYDPGAATGRCAPRFEAGEVCTGGGLFDCGDSLVCVSRGKGEPSVCGVPPAEGERCVPREAFSCARSDDWCDPEEGICKRRIPLDAPCGPVEASCVRYAVCNGGTCSLPPTEGEPCVPLSGPIGTLVVSLRCAPGLSCVSEVCVVNDAPPQFGPAVCK